MEQKTFDEMIDPFRLKIPTDVKGVKKWGRECCIHCRTCVFHRPHRKERYCVFRECPFFPGLSTSTYALKKENRKRNRRRSAK
jgi:hypothetical protein